MKTAMYCRKALDQGTWDTSFGPSLVFRFECSGWVKLGYEQSAPFALRPEIPKRNLLNPKISIRNPEPIYRSIHLHIFRECGYMYISVYTDIYTYADTYTYTCISVSISKAITRTIYLSIYLSIHPSIYLSIYLSICLYADLCVYLYVHI